MSALTLKLSPLTKVMSPLAQGMSLLTQRMSPLTTVMSPLAQGMSLLTQGMSMSPLTRGMRPVTVECCHGAG